MVHVGLLSWLGVQTGALQKQIGFWTSICTIEIISVKEREGLESLWGGGIELPWLIHF